MKHMSQVSVRTKSGDDVRFEVEDGIDGLDKLCAELNRWYTGWLYIGKHALIKKDEIEGVYYIENGIDSRVDL
jgi:hypothetical protein